jgi:hypothetical protein
LAQNEAHLVTAIPYNNPRKSLPKSEILYAISKDAKNAKGSFRPFRQTVCVYSSIGDFSRVLLYLGSLPRLKFEMQMALPALGHIKEANFKFPVIKYATIS